MLKSVNDVIDALGGTAAAASLLDVTPPAVSNWRVRRKIPAENFPLVREALAREGKEVDPAVFGFKLNEARA